MITPIGNIAGVNPQPASPPAPPQHPQTVKSGTLSQDQVTLKNAGQVDPDHDGD